MTDGVYFKECGKFETDKERLIKFTKMYSKNVDSDLKWIELYYKKNHHKNRPQYVFMKSSDSTFKFSNYPLCNGEDVTHKLCKYLGEL